MSFSTRHGISLEKFWGCLQDDKSLQPSTRKVKGEEVTLLRAGSNSSHQFYLGRLRDGRWVGMSQSWEPIPGSAEIWEAFHASYAWDSDRIFDAIEAGEGNHLPLSDELVETIHVYSQGDEPWYFGNRR